jgi:hypothetical protein
MNYIRLDCLKTFSVSRICSFGYYVDRRMVMNWEVVTRIGRDLLDALSRHLPGRAEEKKISGGKGCSGQDSHPAPPRYKSRD